MASAQSTTMPAAGPSGPAPAASGSTTTVPAPPPAASAGGTTAGTRVNNLVQSTFGMPSGISLPIFDGSDYSNWAGILEAILQLHEADDIIRHSTALPGADIDEFATIARHAKAYLCLFIKPEVYLLIASDVDYPTFKDKWDHLCNTYGGTSGSTDIFNTWIQLTQARLDESAPMAPQLAKLNEAWVQLHNASMGVTDTQYCLILLHTLPSSYEVLASTILAGGTPNTLRHTEITARIISEEARHSGPSGSSLNAAAKAPIKASGKGKGKKDHSNLTCHYCNKKGHIKPDCCKRKKDEENKKKEEGSSSSAKATNSHVHVPSTASITEVNDIGVALYAAERVR